MAGSVRLIGAGVAAGLLTSLLLRGEASSGQVAPVAVGTVQLTDVRSKAQPAGQAAPKRRTTRGQPSSPADGGVAGPCPGLGDCCVNNGSPGCDDLACCNAICANDPFCCKNTWDQLCADAGVADPVNCPQCQPPPPPVGDECEIAKLLASDGANGDRFGISVSISGDVAVVGAFGFDIVGPDVPGSAYVFGWNGLAWVQQAKLTASDGVDDDFFGVSVSISGDVVVIGASRTGVNNGSAYVFQKPPGGWMNMTQTAKLTASDTDVFDFFGFSVSISDDVLVVGAKEEFSGDPGKAYVFVKPPGGWVDMTQTARLTASDGAADDLFGWSVSISGEVAVIGAYVDDDNGSDSGSAYVFQKPVDGWVNMTQTAKLTASDGAAGDNFGISVAISRDVIQIGAPFADGNVASSGSAYVFVQPPGGWVTGTETAKLTASDGAALDEFGGSVSISDDVIVVGAAYDDDNAGATGSAYVFVKSPPGWVDMTQTAKLTASDGAFADALGNSASISGDVAVIGASFDDDNGPSSGSAYVFGVPGLDCNGNDLPDACDVFLGTSSDFNANLIPDECDSFAYNLTQVTFHGTIADAIATAVHGDVLLASPVFFTREPDIDFAGKSIALSSFAEIDQPAGGLYVLADSSALSAAVGSHMTLAGELRVGVTDNVDLFADQIMISATGLLTAQPGAGVDIAAPNGLINDGAISSLGAVLGVSPGLTNSILATMTSYGDIVTNLTNDGQATYIADTQFLGDYLNNGTTTIQNGTLTIIGTLTNNGTIIGDVAGGAASGLPVAAGDGLAVIGDYAAGVGASLVMPSPDLTVKIAGNYEVAINNNISYDMAQAELRMIGLGGLSQSLEVMSLDIGPDPAGLDRTLPGHYPIGTLRIGPTRTTVNMTDIHDNDALGQKLSEAIYVENLIIEAGATLNTLVRPVYYVNLTNNGAVDDPANLIALPPPSSTADISGPLGPGFPDGCVDAFDLGTLLGAWCSAAGDPDPPKDEDPPCEDCTSPNFTLADISGAANVADGCVDAFDLAKLLAEWCSVAGGNPCGTCGP